MVHTSSFSICPVLCLYHIHIHGGYNNLTYISIPLLRNLELAHNSKWSQSVSQQTNKQTKQLQKSNGNVLCCNSISTYLYISIIFFGKRRKKLHVVWL